MLKSSLSIIAIILLLLCSNANESLAIPVDLSGWTATDTVTLSDGGYTATFTEDPTFGPVYLRSILDIPADAVTFSFDYELVVATGGNEDYFDFYFDDTSQYFFSEGGYDSGTEANIFSGNYTVQLLPYAGDSVDVIFGLNWGWGDFGLDSILTISNVDMAATSPVPEPGTLILIGTGLAGLAGLRKRNPSKPS